MLFPVDGLDFLRVLSENNTKEWFHANKPNYEAHIKQPAKNLASAVSEVLAATLGNPVENKVFRINRDLRFSKDKTPYNTHVRFSFWQNTAEQPVSTPAFHVSIEPQELIVGAGCMQMPPTMLCRFRSALKSEKSADTFSALISKIELQGATLSEPELKRVPQGIEPTHPQSTHMRRKGIVCWHRHRIATAEPITAEQILDTTSALMPLYLWLQALEKGARI